MYTCRKILFVLMLYGIKLYMCKTLGSRHGMKVALYYNITYREVISNRILDGIV